MTNDEKLLCGIHRAAEMGRDSLARVLQSVQDEHFKNTLSEWQQRYSRYYISADVLLKASGGDDSGLGSVSRMMGDVMTDMSLLMDDSDAHIAEMLFKGTEQGIEQLSGLLQETRGSAGDEAVTLAKNMQAFLLACRSDLQARMRKTNC